MVTISLTQPHNLVYRHCVNLLQLIPYARQNQHSCQWVAAIVTIMARKGGWPVAKRHIPKKTNAKPLDLLAAGKSQGEVSRKTGIPQPTYQPVGSQEGRSNPTPHRHHT